MLPEEWSLAVGVGLYATRFRRSVSFQCLAYRVRPTRHEGTPAAAPQRYSSFAFDLLTARSGLQYLPLRELDDVTSALNFDTADCHVVGSCDIYTTKAAGGDKKLYKNIEHTLESQYETLLRFSVSLSPPEAKVAGPLLNLSRSSPFGSLSQISSRRIFAYLIATLNASHPDYEFSHLLRPSDFRRERSLKSVMNTLDTTLYNLRPRHPSRVQTGPSHWQSASHSSPVTGPQWSPRMWRIIDKEMYLKECSAYAYVPEGDLWDGEEGVIWSLNYFFFSKTRKRVCYIYLRGLSLTSDGSVPQTPLPSERTTNASSGFGDLAELVDAGASKRADFWLGDRATSTIEDEPNESMDEDDEPRLLSPEIPRTFVRTADESGSPFSERSRDGRSLSRSRAVRDMSEEITATMEV